MILSKNCGLCKGKSRVVLSLGGMEEPLVNSLVINNFLAHPVAPRKRPEIIRSVKPSLVIIEITMKLMIQIRTQRGIEAVETKSLPGSGTFAVEKQRLFLKHDSEQERKTCPLHLF
jgi:hypothetical protein